MRRLAAFVALFAVGCGSTTGDDHCGAPALERPILALETNWSDATALARLGTDGCIDEQPADPAYGFDSVLVESSDDHSFVINRGEGIVFDIDPSDYSLNNEYVTFSMTQPHTNPWSADRDPDGFLWVAQYDRSSITVIRPDGKIDVTIDLSSPVDFDGIPDMEAVRVVGENVFVLLEHLDSPGSPPTQLGGLAVLDWSTKSQIPGSPFTLGGQNPFGAFHPFPSDPFGKKYAVCLAGDTTPTGTPTAENGIYAVELEDPPSSTQLVSAIDLDGFCWDVAIASETEAYVITASYAQPNATKLRPFNPSTGALGQPMLETDTFSLSGLTIDGTRVVVGDHSATSPRIVVFDRASKAKLGEIATQNLPPVQLETL